jgi:hypothetical protein
MAGAPWRHWGIVVRRCSDSAKEVSRSQGPLSKDALDSVHGPLHS